MALYIGAVFVKLLATYAKSMLRKGVPPLFVSLRCLYKDTDKVYCSLMNLQYATMIDFYVQVALIEQLFLAFAASLEKCQKFPDGTVDFVCKLMNFHINYHNRL